MDLHKRAPRFFLIFLTTFGVALVAWEGLGSFYGALFRGAGDVLAVGSGPWTVKYSRHLDLDSNHDTQVLLRNRQDGLQRDVNLSSRRMAYMPTAFLIALVLATPTSRERKRLALLWGFIGVHFYIALRLALVPATYIALRGEESRETLLTSLEWVFSGSSAGWMVVPLVIWLIVTLKCCLPLASPDSSQNASDNTPN